MNESSLDDEVHKTEAASSNNISTSSGGATSATAASVAVAGSKRRRVPEVQRSLCFILVALKNEVVTIELKNENTITGTVIECDSAMNVTLSDAEIKSSQGEVKCLETVYIAGAWILYVHVPPRTRMVQHANSHAQALQRLSDHKRHRITDSNKQRRILEAAKHETIVIEAARSQGGEEEEQSFYY